MKKKILIIVTNFLIVLLIVVLYVLYRFNYIPHKKYTNEDFNIKTYISKTDKDNDGIDDQTDILNNVMDYIKTNPKYKSGILMMNMVYVQMLLHLHYKVQVMI